MVLIVSFLRSEAKQKVAEAGPAGVNQGSEAPGGIDDGFHLFKTRWFNSVKGLRRLAVFGKAARESPRVLNGLATAWPRLGVVG